MIVTAVGIGIWNIKIRNFEIVNNERYTSEQIVDMLFSTENEKRFIGYFFQGAVPFSP